MESNQTILNTLFVSMIHYYKNDPKRIQHFIKVHSLAKLIGSLENLAEDVQFVLEAAALVHDIGIKPAEAKYGSCSGKLQEQEGPEPARQLLSELDFEEANIERIVYLVAHHHTYSTVDGLDYQILVEADFLVNFYEDAVPKESIRAAYENIFRTHSGKELCLTMFGL